MLVYCPAIATPEAAHDIDAPGASVVAGQETATPWSSVTVTLVSVTFPVLVTRYVHVTVEPAGTYSPGAVSLSVPFVSFTIEILGDPTNPKSTVRSELSSNGSVTADGFGLLSTAGLPPWVAGEGV